MVSNAQFKPLESDVKAFTILAQNLSELEVITYEFLLYRDSWVKKRWLNKKAVVSELEENLTLHIANREKIRHDLLFNMNSIHTTFDQLAININEKNDAIPTDQVKLDERLSGLLLVFIQTSSEMAISLFEQQLNALSEARKVADIAILVFGLIFLLAIGTISLFTLVSILKPISVLRREVSLFGKGVWSARVTVESNDEIGAFASTFNVMAGKIETNLQELNKSYLEVIAYRDNLEKLVDERTLHLQQEISVRKTAESALKDKEAQLLEILNTSPYGVSIVSVKNRSTMYVNSRFVDMCGSQSAQRLLKQNIADSFVNQEDASQIWAMIERDGYVNKREQQRKRLDGSTWWELVDCIPFNFENQSATLIWHEDITERKATYQRLIQTEKMASLGRLVTGVAHEINTPLGICVTAASYFKEIVASLGQQFTNKKLTEKSLNEFLESTQKAIPMLTLNLDRAANLISIFKKVSVDQSNEQPRKINCNDYFHDILLSLQKKLKSTNIVVELICAANIELLTYPGALSQTIAILVMNSLSHAFEDQQLGTINIEIMQQDEQVLIQYRDSGKGVPKDISSKIFDPFFTTNRSSGAGLGLNIAYNQVVSLMGGSLIYKDAPGGGAAFDISLPSIE